jgi:hypothetical protein
MSKPHPFPLKGITMKRFAALALLAASSLLALAQPTVQAPQQAAITAINSTPTATCSAGSCVPFIMEGQGSATVQLGGTAWTASGGLSAQVTTDGSYWVTLSKSSTFTRLACSSSCTSATIPSGTINEIYQLSAECTAARACRITALGAVTGSAAVTVRTSPVSLGGGSAGTVTGGTDGVAQGSATSGQSGVLVQGAVTTAAPTYSSGQTSPLSLDTTGAVRVNVVAGGAGGGAVTQSGTWSTRLQDGSGNAVTSAARGSERALTVQLVDGSGAQITSFGGSGGTASNFGSATPATGTAAGYSDGTNMQAAHVADVDSGAGTQYALVVSPRLSASGGAIELTGGSGAAAAGTLRVVAATDSPEVAGIGGVSDAAATQGSTGSVSAKLRTVTSQLNTIDGKLVGGAGAVGSSTLRTTQASDSPLVTATGATADAACGTDNGTCSLAALIKRNNQNLTTLNTSVNADPNYTQAPGSAAPSRALAMGARSGANLVAITQASATAAINVSTATTTQLVALSSGQVIHVTAASVIAGGTGNITFVYGTGTNCGTGTTSLTGAYPLIANAGLSIGSGLGPVLVVPAGNALCVTTSAAVQMSGHVAYTQFTP